MNTEWYDLISSNGNKVGRIKVGIQYIYDQVKLIDAIIEKRSEDRDFYLKDLEESQDILKFASAPFENLIRLDKGVSGQSNNDPTIFEEALDKIAATIYKGITPIEDYVVNNAKTLPTAVSQWGLIAQTGSLTYALLSLIIAFTSEDFINVLLK